MRTANFLIFVCFLSQFHAQVRFCSWNIQNFGRSKSDSTIQFIAETIKDYDVVAIVEVVAGNGGAQAVARLADELNRTGTKWDYVMSDPTQGTPGRSERYAFLWKTSRLKKIGEAWLEKNFEKEIEREPYFASFEENGNVFTLVTFHALPKSKQPETEIKFFKFFPEKYPDLNMLFSGDFNCPESHTVFNPLKNANYIPSLSCRKTSLKNECVNGDCLASEYDNIFYNPQKIRIISAGVIEFYKLFPSMRHARKISDHCPVYMEFIPL